MKNLNFKHLPGSSGCTHLGALIVEALQEALQELVGVVNPLGVFANNPDHGGTSVRLIQRVEVFAQRSDDALIPEETTADMSEKQPQPAQSFSLQSGLNTTGMQRSVCRGTGR